MMSCFNKMLDCVDILEVVAATQKKKDMTIAMAESAAEEVGRKLYPILFAEKFQYNPSQRHESKIHD